MSRYCSSAARAQVPGRDLVPRGAPDEGDKLLAALLIRMWTLASGRTLRSDVPPGQLSPEELITFWADDLTRPTGRHALAVSAAEDAT